MKIISLLKNFLPHKKNDKNHYGRFTGSFNLIRLISWNMFHPFRLINRFRWKVLFSNKNLKIRKYKKKISQLDDVDNKLFNKLGLLIDNGGLLINDYFSKEKTENFLNEYRDLIDGAKKSLETENFNSSNGRKLFYNYKKIKLPLSQALVDLWLDDHIIQFLEHFLGRKVYAREHPRLVYVKSYFDDVNSRDDHAGNYKDYDTSGPFFWHVDHTAGLVTLHILFEDTDLNSTHMQYLAGSNKYLNTRDLYSDETVSNFKNEPSDCTGKKGTIYFHSGNTLHRVVGRKGSHRLGILLSFSPGSGIEFDCNKISTAFSGKFKIESLSKKKREILKGIYPLSGNPDLIDGNLSKPKFNEGS